MSNRLRLGASRSVASMDRAASRAYAASAEALVLNVLAYGSDILGLEPGVERLRRDKADPRIVRLDAGVGESFPLVSMSMEAFRRRGPGSPTEVMIRGLGRLALARVWRRRGTVAPPAGTVHVNAIAKALVEHCGVAPQAFIDAAWSPVATFDKYTDTADWRTAGETPGLLLRAPVLEHPECAMPSQLPWMAGYANGDAIFVEAAALAPGLAIYWKPSWGDEAEIRLPSGLPSTLVAGAVNRPLRQVLSQPVLDRFPLMVVGAASDQRTTRLRVRGDSPWKRIRFAGGTQDRADVATELKALKPARRQLEALIKRMLTVVGNDHDVVHVPCDDDFLLDDEFLGGDIEAEHLGGVSVREPVGVAQRRAIVDRTWDDGDMIAGWNEDMVQQLESEQAMFDVDQLL